MLRRQSLVALAVAVFLGLIAVYLANVFLNARANQLESSPTGTTKVAVAAVALTYGTELTPDKIKYVDYPSTALPQGIYHNAAELLPQGKSRTVLRPIALNQPLIAPDLTGEGQNASIAALLPDGMRASSVRVNDVSGVAGFVKPNDTVDVLITRQAIGGNGQVTDVLLQNVRVIAMDQDSQGRDGQPVVSRTATLEVSPIDAQKLVLGQQLGSLSLVLRKPGAEQNIPTIETVSLADLRYGLYGTTRPAADAVPIRRLAIPRPPPRPARRAPAAGRPATNKVEVLRGTTTSTYEVGTYAR